MSKVQALKTDLHDWRTKLEIQVQSYKTVGALHVHVHRTTTRRSSRDSNTLLAWRRSARVSRIGFPPVHDTNSNTYVRRTHHL